MTARLTARELGHFAGDDVRYRHPLNPSVIYTPGVRHVAEKGEAYWLIDAIASYFGSPQMRRAIAGDERLGWLQFWRLTVNGERQGRLICQAETGEPAAIIQAIPFTDFPLDRVEIWAGFDGRHWTLYLPSEH